MSEDRKEIERQPRQARQKGGPRLAELVSRISDGVLGLDQGFRVTFFNQAAERLLGRPASEVLGRGLFEEAFPGARGSIFEERYTRAFADQVPQSFEAYFSVKPYANWYDVKAYPTGEGLLVFFSGDHRKPSGGAGA